MAIPDHDIEAIVRGIVESHGEGVRARALEGVCSASALWRESDGDTAAFRDFCRLHFVADERGLDLLQDRLERLLETAFGAFDAVALESDWNVHVETGPLLPSEGLVAGWSPRSHLAEDLFAGKLAFAARLNFPYVPLECKLLQGRSWTRRDWARARLGDVFADRVPAAASQGLATAMAGAEAYVNEYNLHAECLLDGTRKPWNEPRRLLMHWNVRDEIRASYADPEGLVRQRVLARAMERVVDGSIPRRFVNSTAYLWDPVENRLARSDGSPAGAEESAPEGALRYEPFLEVFRKETAVDAFSPDYPTLIARRFGIDREIPEPRVESLFTELLGSPLLEKTARSLSGRLGRPLEPFDIWYRGFGTAVLPDETGLSAETRARYPNALAFEKDIPRILSALGFDAAEAAWLAERIKVDPARGSGHAMPSLSRDAPVRLRTRIPEDGMDWKGFSIACHELGHNVEQAYSMHGIDEYFLAGVPNTAFTEAFAFTFQDRAMLALGRGPAGKESAALSYWQACEIAAVALVDMEAWRWLYAHPSRDAPALRDAVTEISRRVWNRCYARIFGVKDSLVLGTYQHMLGSALYLPDYPLGHIIAFQIESWLGDSLPGTRMGDMCRLGRLCPDEWMRQAIGEEISVKPLLRAAEAELRNG